MLDVCLLGTAGMMPQPNRWLTALMTRYNGKSLLIDCGEGTQIAMRQAGLSPNPIEVICFTHYHADHISGLPGLLLSMGNSDRTQPVTMIGPKGLERVVNSLRVIAPELPFEIQFIELDGPEQKLEIAGYHITAYRVKHNVLCYGYTIEIPRDGRFDVEAAKALGLPVQTWNQLQKGNVITYEGKQYTPDMVMGPPRQGIKVAYCTDTRPVDTIAEHAKRADLFICEGMYAEPDKLGKAKQYKHMTFYEAAALARDAQVAEMWLTHFSPSLVGAKGYMKEVKKIFPNAFLGEDGKMVELDFKEG
jgi:ribonuclease Z